MVTLFLGSSSAVRLPQAEMFAPNANMLLRNSERCVHDLGDLIAISTIAL